MLHGYPVFDNFMHIRRNGFYLDAINRFKKYGGTAINHVNFPDYDYTPVEHYSLLYNDTEKISGEITKAGINTVTTIGPYPLDCFYFISAGLNPVDYMKTGIDIAVKHIISGMADALGEIGYPHFPVDDCINKISEEITIYAMQACNDHDIPLILHTPDMDINGYKHIKELAYKYYNPERILKHHAEPQDIEHGFPIIESLIASRKNVREAIASGHNFMLETDYTDQKEKPNKVIPPESVPKRAEMIINEYENHEEILYNIFSEVPYSFYRKEFFNK